MTRAQPSYLSLKNMREERVLYHYRAQMSRFTRLVRFLAQDGKTYYGDAILPKGVTDAGKASSARIIRGPIFGAHEVTEEVAVRARDTTAQSNPNGTKTPTGNQTIALPPFLERHPHRPVSGAKL